MGKRHGEQLRRLCMAYPEVVEVEQFGNPWWKAGKRAFCIYAERDRGWGAAFFLTRQEQAILMLDPRFTPTGHIAQHGWTSLQPDGDTDWDEIVDLIDSAYRHVALKRMLRALDGN